MIRLWEGPLAPGGIFLKLFVCPALGFGSPARVGAPLSGEVPIRREARQFEVASPRPAAAEKHVAAPEGDGVEGFERPAAKYKR
jgi:hypothetical protein